MTKNKKEVLKLDKELFAGLNPKTTLEKKEIELEEIEAGATPNPTIDTVKKIADALGVSLDDLMK